MRYPCQCLLHPIEGHVVGCGLEPVLLHALQISGSGLQFIIDGALFVLVFLSCSKFMLGNTACPVGIIHLPLQLLERFLDFLILSLSLWLFGFHHCVEYAT